MSASTLATSGRNLVELDKRPAALTPYAERGFHLDRSVMKGTLGEDRCTLSSVYNLPLLVFP